MESREQLMRTKMICEKLSRVEAKLVAATESLIGMQLGKGPRERAALMSEAAALLQDIYHEIHSREIHLQETHLQETDADSSWPRRLGASRTGGGGEPDSPATEPRTVNFIAAAKGKAEILPVLCGIQVRMGQLGQLNDAALCFCRRWLSAQPAPAIDYTCEGIWAN